MSSKLIYFLLCLALLVPAITSSSLSAAGKSNAVNPNGPPGQYTVPTTVFSVAGSTKRGSTSKPPPPNLPPPNPVSHGLIEKKLIKRHI